MKLLSIFLYVYYNLLNINIYVLTFCHRYVLRLRGHSKNLSNTENVTMISHVDLQLQTIKMQSLLPIIYHDFTMTIVVRETVHFTCVAFTTDLCSNVFMYRAWILVLPIDSRSYHFKSTKSMTWFDGALNDFYSILNIYKTYLDSLIIFLTKKM